MHVRMYVCMYAMCICLTGRHTTHITPLGARTTTLYIYIYINVHDCVSTHVDELLLLPLVHVPQAVVAPSQVSLQAGQRHHRHALHLAALGARARRRQAQPPDAAAGADARRQHVALVKHARGDLMGKETPTVMTMMTLTCLRRSKQMIAHAKQAHACAGIMDE